jgi:ADP-ribose pyrophosphatase YjhB (NUDIX family)
MTTGMSDTRPGDPSSALQSRQKTGFGLKLVMAARSLIAPVALGASGMMLTPDRRVVLVRHTYMSGLGFPGGGVARGEAAEAAVIRELTEEIGPFHSDPPELVGVFSRRAGWATNVIVLYRLTNAVVENFKPNAEIREIVFADPANPPRDVTPGTARRLIEHVSGLPPAQFW